MPVIEDAIPLDQYMPMEIVMYLVYIISPLLCGLVIATLVYVLLEFRLTEACFIARLLCLLCSYIVGF